MRTTDAKPVVDGQRIKWTLEQHRQSSPSGVRVDWLRFTVPLDAIVRTDEDQLGELRAEDLIDQSARDLVRQCRAVETASVSSGALAVARAGAMHVASLIPGLEVGAVEDKGMDYYAARCSLLAEGTVCGFVLAGGKSTRQAATVHVNLHGSACLRVSHAQWAAVAEFIRGSSGWITRVDLALDVFRGASLPAVEAAYIAGAFDVRGKRPGQQNIGSWTLGHSRTFQVGSRDTGKLFRGYEKGDQLFGHEAADDWVRFEVEFRNNHRVIEAEVLERPADFFAGAYAFCADALTAYSEEASPERIVTTARLADKTAEGAVTRVVSWLRRTAGPALAAAFWHGGDLMGALIEEGATRTTGRLRGYSLAELRQAFEKVAQGLAPPCAPSANGAA